MARMVRRVVTVMMAVVVIGVRSNDVMMVMVMMSSSSSDGCRDVLAAADRMLDDGIVGVVDLERSTAERHAVVLECIGDG